MQFIIQEIKKLDLSEKVGLIELIFCDLDDVAICADANRILQFFFRIDKKRRRGNKLYKSLVSSNPMIQSVPIQSGK